MTTEEWLKAAESTVYVLGELGRNNGAPRDGLVVEYYHRNTEQWLRCGDICPAGVLLRFAKSERWRPYCSSSEWFSLSAGGWRYARRAGAGEIEGHMVFPCGRVCGEGVEVDGAVRTYKCLLDQFEVANHGNGGWHRAGVNLDGLEPKS